MPYRDIFDMNLPGVYLLHWAVLATVGGGDLAWRLVDLGWLAATAALLFALLPAAGGRRGRRRRGAALRPVSPCRRRLACRPARLPPLPLPRAPARAGSRAPGTRGGSRMALLCGGAALGAGLTVKPYAVGLFWLGSAAAGAAAARRAGRARAGRVRLPCSAPGSPCRPWSSAGSARGAASAPSGTCSWAMSSRSMAASAASRSGPALSGHAYGRTSSRSWRAGALGSAGARGAVVRDPAASGRPGRGSGRAALRAAGQGLGVSPLPARASSSARSPRPRARR